MQSWCILHRAGSLQSLPVVNWDYCKFSCHKSNQKLDNNMPIEIYYPRQATDNLCDCWNQASETNIAERGYAPPDHGQTGLSRRRDVFAFGVLLLELLTGRKSFDGYVFLTSFCIPFYFIFLPVGLNNRPFFSFNTVAGQERNSIWRNGPPPGSVIVRVWNRWWIPILK